MYKKPTILYRKKSKIVIRIPLQNYVKPAREVMLSKKMTEKIVNLSEISLRGITPMILGSAILSATGMARRKESNIAGNVNMITEIRN